MANQDKSITPIENSINSAPVAELFPIIGVVESKGISQKKAIETLIPHIYVIRKKGCSWEQIAGLLNDKCGFMILPSTVRTYFSELVPKHREACMKMLSEHFLAMKKSKE